MASQGDKLGGQVSGYEPGDPVRVELPSSLTERRVMLEGVVVEVLPDSRYKVTLDNGHTLIAYAGGKMRKHHIRILAGDRVSLELSPYDLSKGRITFRHLDSSRGPSAPRRRTK